MKYLFLILFLLSGCTSHRVDDIKLHAEKTFNQAGFKVIGYEGYEYGFIQTYGGCVWYTLDRNGITYDACISKWGDEYHIYSLNAKDAVKGN